jgi:hypothetical protein
VIQNGTCDAWCNYAKLVHEPLARGVHIQEFMNNSDIITFLQLLGSNFASATVEHRVDMANVKPGPKSPAYEDANTIGQVAFSLGGLLAWCGFRDACK